jgi:hypothetical protein
MEEKGNSYGILVGKPEGKRPVGRPRCRYLDNIEMHLRDIDVVVRTGLFFHGTGTIGRFL